MLLSVLSAKAESRDTAGTGNRYALILCSYAESVGWAVKLTNDLEISIRQEYPGLQVYAEYLGMGNTFSWDAMSGRLRAILYSRTRNKVDPEKAAFDLSMESVLGAGGNKPEVIAIIGDEMANMYLRLAEELYSWKEVPVVLCGVDDTLVAGRYRPDVGLNQPPFEPVGAYRSMIPASGDTIVMRLSGVIHRQPLEEMLCLIETLVPGVKELVFIDKRSATTEYLAHRVSTEIPRLKPGLKTAVRFVHWLNEAATYREVLGSGKDVVFLTFNFDFARAFDNMTPEEVNVLYEAGNNPVVFTFSPYCLEGDRILGGYALDCREHTQKTMDIIRRVLKGEDPNTIPFVYAENTRPYLNREALEKAGLYETARKLKSVAYVNVPPSFFRQYEKEILYVILLVVLVTGGLVVAIRYFRHTVRLRKSFLDFRELYDELQQIYTYLPISFALYSKNGKRLKSQLDRNSVSSKMVRDLLLPEELMRNKYLSSGDREQLKRRETLNCEIAIEGENDHSGIFQLIVKPMEQGRYGYIAIVIDKTIAQRERKERKRLESLFHFVSDSSNVGIACYNLLKNDGFASDAWFLNLNEKKSNSIVPAYLSLKEEDRVALMESRAVLEKGEGKSVLKNVRVYSADGEWHWIRQFIFVYDYKPEANRIVLIELNLNVDFQQGNETALREAKERAETAYREKEVFMANINHEIRTPLNAIVGFSNLLAVSDDPEERQLLSGLIRKNEELLIQLISDVLDLSQIDSGRGGFVLSDVDVHSVMEEILAYGEELLTDSEVAIVWKDKTDPISIHTDGVRIRQVLKNLVSNAVKFTQQGEIVIRYKLFPDTICFYVSDTGCGMTEQVARQIFRRFVKADSFVQGTGLGLSLCQSIVQGLGGEIWVKSTPGEGSLFCFSIPHPAASGQ